MTERSFRKKSDFFVIENQKAVEDILNKVPERVHYIITSSPDLLHELSIKTPTTPIFLVPNTLIKDLSSLESHQELLAVVQRKSISFEEILPSLRTVILMDAVSNPANFGAIVRNAVAYNVSAVLYTKSTVDPYHPQAVRAMAGNIFQIPFIEFQPEWLDLLCAQNFQIYYLNPYNGIPLSQAHFLEKNLFVFGSEGHGIIEEGIQRLGHPIRIEMSEEIDSLNVAVSSGILLYQLQYSHTT